MLADGGFEVAAQAGDADALRAPCAVRRPELAIVDVRMPPTQTDEGTRAAREIRAEHRRSAVLVLSQTVEIRMRSSSSASSPKGSATCSRTASSTCDEFLERPGASAAAARSSTRGRRAAARPPARATTRSSELTPREREVLGLMAEGRSNRGICKRLLLSPKTVETHVNAIFRKLGLVEEPDEHRRVLAVLAYLRS